MSINGEDSFREFPDHREEKWGMFSDRTRLLESTYEEEKSFLQDSSIVNLDVKGEFYQRWAALLVSEAIEARNSSVASSIRQFNFGEKSDRIRIFQFARSTFVKLLFYVAILLDLSLAFLEPPSTRSVQYKQKEITVMGIEFLLMMVMALQVYLEQYYSTKEKYFKSPWHIFKVFLIILTMCELIAWTPPVLLYNSSSFRVSRFLRPFFLIEQGDRLRFIFTNVCATIFRIRGILFFVLMYIVFFTFLFYFMLKDNPEDKEEGNQYFITFDKSFISLFILLTTANFPDVMLPFYRVHTAYVIPFVVYIVFGLYLLMNMIFATIYNLYEKISSNEIRVYVENRQTLLLEAFDILDRQCAGEIDLETWKEVIPLVRPDLKDEIIEILFFMVDTDQRGTISETEFMRVCDYLDLVIKRKTRNAALEREGFYFLRKIVDTKAFSVIVNLLIIGLATLTIVQSYLPCDFDPKDCNHLVMSQAIISILFMVELVMKVFGYGPRLYFSYGWNRIDAAIILVTEIGIILEMTLFVTNTATYRTLHWLNVLCALRTFKVIASGKQGQSIIATFVDLLPITLPFVGVLFAWYYFYALVGMQLYDGLLTPEDERLHHTMYGQLDYYCNNFDNLSNALIVLFELMVVNNWEVTMFGVVAVTNDWNQLYFLIWYIITVVVVLNLILALVVEAFVVRYETSKKKDSWDSEVKQRFADAQQLLLGKEEYKCRVPRRLFRLYMTMFKFNEKPGQNGVEESHSFSDSEKSEGLYTETDSVSDFSSEESDDDDDNSASKSSDDDQHIGYGDGEYTPDSVMSEGISPLNTEERNAERRRQGRNSLFRGFESVEEDMYTPSMAAIDNASDMSEFYYDSDLASMRSEFTRDVSEIEPPGSSSVQRRKRTVGAFQELPRKTLPHRDENYEHDESTARVTFSTSILKSAARTIDGSVGDLPRSHSQDGPKSSTMSPSEVVDKRRGAQSQDRPPRSLKRSKTESESSLGRKNRSHRRRTPHSGKSYGSISRNSQDRTSLSRSLTSSRLQKGDVTDPRELNRKKSKSSLQRGSSVRKADSVRFRQRQKSSLIESQYDRSSVTSPVDQPRLPQSRVRRTKSTLPRVPSVKRAKEGSLIQSLAADPDPNTQSILESLI